MFIKIRKTGLFCFTAVLVFGFLGTGYGIDTIPETAVKEEKAIAHYPDRFDGTGRIDSLEGDHIVIDDSLYRLSTYVKFCTHHKQIAPRILFKNGTHVGYVKNSEGKISGIYLLE